MTNRTITKRVETLERYTGGLSYAIILNRKGEAPEQAVARWEAENGALGARSPVMVSFVDAAI